ncbi:MAG: hypothetical protein ACRC1T_18275 [Clostridium chrysemydis]|uniref:hypothetical protein n=1 Tax=Clostridium chrysemydis TaxID=2665504 RepID=UPI003F394830
MGGIFPFLVLNIMVNYITFIIVLICFLGTNVILERKYKKAPPRYKMVKVIGLCVVYEFILLTGVVLIPATFKLLIYGSVVMGSFLTVYFRYKPSIVMEV